MQIQHAPFTKIADRQASQICARVDLSGEAKALLVDDLSPQGFLAVLTQNERWADAIRYMAFSLPPREAIWWACVICRSIGSAVGARSESCVALAERWVFQPSEAAGRACYVAAEALKFEGAAAYVALAAFWTGPSLAPEGLPAVAPDPSLCPTGVGASVLLAVAGDDPLRAADLYRMAIASAVDIANGGNGQAGAVR